MPTTKWINCLLKPHNELPAKTPVKKTSTKIFPVSVADSTEYLSFAEAKRIADSGNKNGHAGLLGVGFVFAASDDFVGVDLDFDTGNTELAEKLERIALKSGAYVERSLNGGLHVIGRLRKRRKIARKFNTDGFRAEVYTHGRYFVWTGKRLAGCAVKKSADMPFIDGWLDKLLGKLKQSTLSTEDRDKPGRSPALTDKEVLSLLGGSKSALTWLALHEEGDLVPYSGDHSAAVFAWHGMVAFYTQNLQQVTRLFRKSALCTGKWERGKWERVNRGPDGQHARILRTCERFYSAPEGASTEDGANGHDKYVELLLELFSPPRKDIFQNDVFVVDPAAAGAENPWRSTSSTQVESALKRECVRRKDYSSAAVMWSIHNYGRYIAPGLLIDVPEWDGTDRITWFAECLNCAEESFTAEIVTDLLKDWASCLWQRVFNPDVQNRCLILQGRQGVGKDVFWATFTRGLSFYTANLTLTRYGTEKDYAETVTRSAVCIISEFDKINAVGMGTLKDLITKPYFDYRASYARVSERHYNRCSFLGACNPSQVLTDSTGNRRFVVLKLNGAPGEAVRWEYPQDAENGMQLLAQFKALGIAGYESSAETEKVIRRITEVYTPEDPNDFILSCFDDHIVERLADTAATEGFFKFAEIETELTRAARAVGVSVREALALLSHTGRVFRYKPHGNARYYGLPEHCADFDCRKRVLSASKITIADLH